MSPPPKWRSCGYVVYPRDETFGQAKASCEREGLRMATVTSRTQQDELLAALWAVPHTMSFCVGNINHSDRWCCAAACGTCGGSGCGSRVQGYTCCTGDMVDPCLTPTQHTCLQESGVAQAASVWLGAQRETPTWHFWWNSNPRPLTPVRWLVDDSLVDAGWSNWAPGQPRRQHFYIHDAVAISGGMR